MTSAPDATPSAGSGAEHSFENVSCAKQARHFSKSEERALRETSETVRRPTAFCSVEIVGRGSGESGNRLPTGRV